MVVGSAESSYSSSIEPPSFGPSESAPLGFPVHVWVWVCKVDGLGASLL